MSNSVIPNGYVVIARKIRRSPLWLSLKATHRLVMIELLLQAQYQSGTVVRNGVILDLKRGQIATSYQQLVDDIHDKEVTTKVVRNAIDKLIKHQFITKDEAKARAKQGLLLTVVNYDFYQSTENYKKSVIEVTFDHDQGKQVETGSNQGKERVKGGETETPDGSSVSGLRDGETGKDGGKEKGITGAKHGQSRGKAGAINNKDKNLNNGNKVKINTLSRQRKTYAEDDLNLEVASYLHKRIMAYAEGIGVGHLVRDADMQKWADECRKMLEIDKRDKDELRSLIDWATSHTFWQGQILSPTNLRKKYTELCIKMAAGKNKPPIGGKQVETIREMGERIKREQGEKRA